MGLKEDWQKALAEIEPESNPDALTASELARLWGCPRTTARERIAQLVKTGRAQQTHKRVTGQRAHTAYILSKKR